MGLPRFRRVKGARSYGSTRLEAAIKAAAHALVMRRKQSGRVVGVELVGVDQVDRGPMAKVTPLAL